MYKSLVRGVSLLSILLFSGTLVFSQVRLPRLVSNGMVLQRDANTNIWGWASPGERITVTFLGSTYAATADPKGKWKIQLPQLKAGGPFEMVVKGNNEITLQDILVGDVWVCSGQSNMEMTMAGLKARYPEDISTSENKFIRHFAVPRKYMFSKSLEDVSGGTWVSANPENVLRFTAAGYYFARKLYEKYKVPIGLINATLGGARTESWMSDEALKPFPTLYADAVKYKDTTVIIQTEAEDRSRITAWHKRAKETDVGYSDPAGPYSKANYNAGEWDETSLPAYWTTTPLGPMNGVVWYRREFELPASFASKAAKLNFGNIVEVDSVFINGKFVGARPSQYITRVYDIPPDLLMQGKNSITVRVVCPSGRGGFVPDKQYAIVLGNENVDL
ncbi:MAG TPA: sialate O-acetylesterase, partial [Cyclobacteriaceae bacterium]|nr:sialate O-acetylesterase [Cyclobacteriaceae bacterium]